MSNEEEEEDQASNIGVGRYPCMPSLVALQQMRNRLHLATLGKKLMKWSALATGRELRKIAKELADSYGNFKTEIADAYILLARCRYFYPNLNKMVIEDKQKEASIGIITSIKPISAGVRSIAFEITESKEPYPHLGIEKGGQMIKDTKKAWADLLKKMILILQLRVSFDAVDTAHRSASKKQNVLGKIIIPKINRTIKYIQDELEEMEREDNFRLKTFKRSKIRKEKEKLGGDNMCTCCLRIFDVDKEMLPELRLCDICSKAKNTKKETPKKPVTCKNITDEMVQYMDEHLDEIKEWAELSTDNVLMKPCCIVERPSTPSKIKPAPVEKVLVETCECPKELTVSHEACLDTCSKPCNVHCSCGQKQAIIRSDSPSQSQEQITIPISKSSTLDGQLVVILIPKPSAVKPSITERQISPQEDICTPCHSKSSDTKPFEETNQSIEPKIIPTSGPCGVESCIEARFIPPPKNIDAKPYEVTPSPTEPETIPVVGPCGVETCIERSIWPKSERQNLPPEDICSPCQSGPSLKPYEVLLQPVEHTIVSIPGPCGVKTCIEERSVPPPKTVYGPCQSAASSSKPCDISQKPIEPINLPIFRPCVIKTCNKSTSDHATPKPEYICSSCLSKASNLIPYQQKIFTPVDTKLICIDSSIKLSKIPSIEPCSGPCISTCSGENLNQGDTSIITKHKEILICSGQNSDHDKLEPHLDVQNDIGQTEMNYRKYIEKVIEITKTKNLDGTVDIEKKVTIRSKNVRLKSKETLSKDITENDDQNVAIDSIVTLTDHSGSRICSSCMPSGDIYTLCSCSENETEKDENPKAVSESESVMDNQANDCTKTYKINNVKSDQNKASPQMYDPKMRCCISDSIFESKAMKIAQDEMILGDDDNNSYVDNENGNRSKHFIEMCLVSNRKIGISSKNILKTENELQCYGTLSEFQGLKQSKSLELTDLSKESINISSVGLPKLKNVESNINYTNEVFTLADSPNMEPTKDEEANISTKIQGVLPTNINIDKPNSSVMSKEVKSEPDKTSLDLKMLKITDPFDKTLHEYENDTIFKILRRAKSDLLVPVTRWKQNKTNGDVSDAKRVSSFNDITTRLTMCKECLMELSGYIPSRNNSRKLSHNCKFCQMGLKKQATQKKNESTQQSRDSSFYSCTSNFVNSYSHICIDLDNPYISIKHKKTLYFPTTQEKGESGKNVFKDKANVEATRHNLPNSEKSNIQLNLAHHDSDLKQTKSFDCMKKMDSIRYHVASKKETDNIINKIEKQLQVNSLLSQIYKSVLSSSICSKERSFYHENRKIHQNTLNKKGTHSHETYLNLHYSENSLPDDKRQNSSKYKTSFELRSVLHEDKNISTTPVSSLNSSYSSVSSNKKKINDLMKAYDNMRKLLKVKSIEIITDKLLHREPSKELNTVESSFHIGAKDTDTSVFRQRSLIDEKEDCVIEYEDCTSCADSEEECEMYEDACVECKKSYKDPISNLLWCETPSCSVNKYGYETETLSKEVCTNNLIRHRITSSKKQKSRHKSTNETINICERLDACTNTKRNTKYDVRSLSNFPKLLKKPNVSFKSGLSKTRKQNKSRSHHHIVKPKKRCKISKPCNSCSDLLSSNCFTLDKQQQQTNTTINNN